MILYFSLMIYLINLGNGKYEISKIKALIYNRTPQIKSIVDYN